MEFKRRKTGEQDDSNNQSVEQDSKDHIFNVVSLRRRIAALDKKAEENDMLRLKHPNSPEKFLQSEVDLDEEVKLFGSLGAHPELLGAFREYGGSRILISLLGHPNPDVALSVVAVLVDIIDPEILLQAGGDEARVFMKTLLEDFDLMAVIADNLERLKEDESDEDFAGVSNLLHCVDHFRDGLFELTITELLRSKRIIIWLLRRVASPMADAVDYNRLFCAELLSNILQASSEARLKIGAPRSGFNKGGFNGIESLLVALSVYKKRGWTSPEEEEYVLNIQDCLILLLSESVNREVFTEAQGIQLLCKILKSGTRVYSVALKVLDVAIIDSAINANLAVASGALGPLFGLFTGTCTRMQENTVQRDKELEIVLSILVLLCEQCQGTEQSRLMAKFFEEGGQKLKRLCAIHVAWLDNMERVKRLLNEESGWKTIKDYTQASSVSECVANDEDRERIENDQPFYAERGELGLVSLQCADRILLTLMNMGNELLTTQCHILLASKLKDDEPMLVSFVAVLREYADHLIDEDNADERRTILRRISLVMTSHDQYLERAVLLKDKAEVAAAERIKIQQAEQLQAKTQERRDRNRRRKVKEKIQKMDRQLEQRERLEEFRWNRKHGYPV